MGAKAGDERSSTHGSSTLIGLAKVLVFGIAIVATFLVARQTAARAGGKLSIDFDPTDSKIHIGVEGGDAMAFQDVLREFWEKDENLSRGILSAWGLEQGIIYVHDGEALQRYELVSETDFWGLIRSLKAKHRTADKAVHINDLARFFKAGLPPEEKEVEVSWHRSEDVPSNALLFAQGDPWFSTKLKRDCDLVFGQDQLQLIVHDSIRLADPKRIQVSEGTFVRVANALEGERVMPPLRSKVWKRLLDKGVVKARVIC